MRRIQYALAAVLAGTILTQSAIADEAITKTVEAIHAEKAELNGQWVTIEGKIVKVNNGVMKRNFLHLQDGSGAEGTNDLTITSQQTANVDDEVVITGKIILDREFGFGYSYPLIMEEATISPAQSK
ncbi:MAG: hypothetical protein GXP14_12590 [Gammaproteobacteria bacterium]|nr:hypothetical protein [Gammaproteobacteria bacterium]